MNAAAFTLRETEGLVRDQVWKFLRYRPAYDREEVLAEAHLLWVQAYRSFDPTRARFSTWLVTTLRYGLLAWERRQSDKLHRVDAEVDMVPERTDLFDALSPDAAEVVALVLEPARSLTRSGLYAALQDLGWGAKRIATAWKELGDIFS